MQAALGELTFESEAAERLRADLRAERASLRDLKHEFSQAQVSQGFASHIYAEKDCFIMAMGHLDTLRAYSKDSLHYCRIDLVEISVARGKHLRSSPAACLKINVQALPAESIHQSVLPIIRH